MSIFNTIGKLVGLISPAAGLAVNTIASIAKEITGESDEQKALEVLEQDPALMAQFQIRLSEERVAMEQEATKQQEAVNKQMAVEAVSGKWWVSGWRPFNGYLFGISVFCSYAIMDHVGKCPWGCCP